MYIIIVLYIIIVFLNICVASYRLGIKCYVAIKIALIQVHEFKIVCAGSDGVGIIMWTTNRVTSCETQ